MTGIVLAGGKSSRMGVDKALLPLNGVRMIDRVLNAVRMVARRIIIVTNTPELYQTVHATIVPDALEQRGPLTGIYTGLLHTEETYNLVVACDMPFLHVALLQYMALRATGYDIVIPAPHGRHEPLHAIYHRGLLSVMHAQILRDDQRIQNVFAHARVLRLTEQDLRNYDGVKLSFRNINTPAEYKEALCAD